jgi:hypothetical protein
LLIFEFYSSVFISEITENIYPKDKNELGRNNKTCNLAIACIRRDVGELGEKELVLFYITQRERERDDGRAYCVACKNKVTTKNDFDRLKKELGRDFNNDAIQMKLTTNELNKNWTIAI